MQREKDYRRRINYILMLSEKDFFIKIKILEMISKKKQHLIKTYLLTIFVKHYLLFFREELLIQQRATREEKKRLRRALKELEAQFEARAGRRMQREDRGPQVTTVYESYKQAKAKLRLIDALVAKKA